MNDPEIVAKWSAVRLVMLLPEFEPDLFGARSRIALKKSMTSKKLVI